MSTVSASSIKNTATRAKETSNYTLSKIEEIENQLKSLKSILEEANSINGKEFQETKFTTPIIKNNKITEKRIDTTYKINMKNIDSLENQISKCQTYINKIKEEANNLSTKGTLLQENASIIEEEQALIEYALKLSGATTIVGTKDAFFTKYNLSEEEIKELTNLCIQEQGTTKGAAAEASLIANRYELYGKDKYDNIVDYAKNSNWWANSKYYMENGADNGITKEDIQAVNDVINNGKRTLPKYIDEHDYLGDIEKVTNNEKTIDKVVPSQYIRNVSEVKQNSNVGSGSWTYYSHPAEGSDPFGYTQEAKKTSTTTGDYHYNSDGVLTTDTKKI